jgi:hypothetical protein
MLAKTAHKARPCSVEEEGPRRTTSGRRPMQSVYTDEGRGTTGRTLPRAFSRQIEAVKEGARIEQVANDYGEFRPAGAGRLLGRCLSPTHEDRTPSMTLYLGDQHFHCYGCGERGDVLDLVGLAEGGELWESMMILSGRYGVSLPERPRSWYAKQERQKPIRDAVERARFDHLRRRLYRTLFAPSIRAIEDRDERLEEAEILYDATDHLARLILAGRAT